jgi:hypothetical protein
MSQLPEVPIVLDLDSNGIPDWDGNGNGISNEYGDGPDLDHNGIPDEIGINPDSLQLGYPGNYDFDVGVIEVPVEEYSQYDFDMSVF